MVQFIEMVPPSILEQLGGFFERRFMVVHVVLNDGSIDGGNPSGALTERGAPPVALLLAAAIPAKFVPSEH